MNGLRILVVCLAALACSGCIHSFYDTAPAEPGSVYVAGGRALPFVGWRPTIWRCPDSGQGECERIKITK